MKNWWNNIRAEFDYTRSRYIPLFKFIRAPFCAFVVWLIGCLLFLSMAIDGSPVFMTDNALNDILFSNSMTVLAIMVITILMAIFNWDKMNALLYTLEALVSWLGFELASLIPIDRTAATGRLFIVTGMGFLFAVIFAYFTDVLIKRKG